MAILKVLKYPHPVLRIPCEPVTAWDASLTRLIADMTETMYASTGAVGLAACQVGVSLRVIVLDVTSRSGREAYKVLINPIVTEASRNKTMREGCLSFPDYLANVKRATKLTVVGVDALSQAPITYTVNGLEAVAVRHEIDHLDGILMIDRVHSLKTDWIRRQVKEAGASGTPLPLNPQNITEQTPAGLE